MMLKRNIIAIVYDFDGTLTPQPMQEYTVLPKIGVQGDRFWKEVNKESRKTKGESIATYMRLMLEESQKRKFPITPDVLGNLAKNIKFFPGVSTFFDRINLYIRDKTNGKIKVRHYVISSGLKEIIIKTKIAKKFHNIFASEYYYDEYFKATFPKIIVNDTLKTQFLFRINKGKEDINESINMYMPLAIRPIPFENILYIGDGLTDVPCMSVTKKNGGYTIAVYQQERDNTIQICKELLEADRVDFIAKADYTYRSELTRLVKIILDTMMKGIIFRNETTKQYIKYIEKTREE